MAATFFAELSGFTSFAELTQPAHYQSVPEDWAVVMTDIRGSTQAIHEGRYKEVNMIGAATIMAVLNTCQGHDLPYAFGGDGATMLVPGAILPQVIRTLEGVQAKVQSLFNLELRAGAVPLDALYAQGTQLLVGKFHLSPHVSQAVFQGSALGLAERWLKDGGGPVTHCNAAAHDDVNLSGLECRWEPIKNQNGTMLSLLVRVAPDKADRSWEIYAQILDAIAVIYPDMQAAKPTKVSAMRISFSPKRLRTEVLLRAGAGLFSRLKYLAKILIINLIGHISFTTGKKPLGFDGARYLSELVANSDVRKFDEMLRMVLDSTPAQQKALEALLEDLHGKGMIVYGLHSSSHALMTCLVFSLAGEHVHFIDGSDGGYALAAVGMKQQLKAFMKA